MMMSGWNGAILSPCIDPKILMTGSCCATWRDQNDSRSQMCGARLIGYLLGLLKIIPIALLKQLLLKIFTGIIPFGIGF